MPDAPPRDPLTAELAAIRARDGKTGRGLSSNVTDYLASQRDVRRLLAAVRVARDPGRSGDTSRARSTVAETWPLTGCAK